ncbi:ectoine/hydroxyectoine ABC transporter permease subunit EhuD [Paenibacillus sp. GCM10027626]|uniref:ectoine/hydroxyectoine ABC transporter permease subunit EhuD n=1 Tax=Paenibacillus sp. GCM10027626 TaxID=3273411 RepID=UPI00362A4EE0
MWDWDYAAGLLPKLLPAFRTTVGVTLLGFLLSIAMGLLLAIVGRSRYRVFRYSVRAVVEFIRSTPLLVQLFFLFMFLPQVLPIAPSAFVTGIITLGVHYGTYLSEVFRSGIDAIPKGQWEAATALHLSKRKIWLSIILPQAIPPVIPVMGNYLIVIFKETPALMAITLGEMLMATKNEVSATYRVFEPYTVVGILFIVVSLIFSYGFQWLERRFLQRKYERKGGEASDSKARAKIGSNA